MYRCGRKFWSALPAAKKNEAMKSFVAASHPPEWVSASMRTWHRQSRGSANKPSTFGKTLLLTFNGDWGINEAWHDATRFSSLDGLVTFIRSEPFAVRLWEDFVEYAKNVQQELQCTDYAAAAEICTETYQNLQQGRLHLHLWVRSPRRIVCFSDSVFRFLNSSGSIAHTVGGQPTTARSASYQGALYLSSHKIGSVFSTCNRRMFCDYIIQPAWVMNLLQCKKITRESARSLILDSAQNVARYLHDLEMMEAETQKAMTAEDSKAVLQALSHLAKPFHRLAEVEAWRLQYLADAFRFKFLVLEGPSRIGKTVFARMTLTPEGKEFYELNCAGDSELDLRGVFPHRHGLIIFDEISPTQVLRQKKVFQAGPTEIQLGQSSTSVYGYSKWFYKMRMVCCSNTWTSVLRTLPKDDADWLEKNSVHIFRTTPLFVEDE
jgi:hypothetical protein